MDRHLTAEVRLFAVHVDGVLVGTGALPALEPGYEELKSLRTAPSMRGKAIRSVLITALLEGALARDPLSLAGNEPFGSYEEDPHSLFLSRRLDV